MIPPRIFNPRLPDEGDFLELEKENSRYIKNVLRLKRGDRIILFDGIGSENEAIIDNIQTGKVTIKITEKKNIKVPDIYVTLAQSLPKGNKMDLITQKSTELGASRIIPFVSSRSIPKLPESRTSSKITRWRKIAIEASRQCGRTSIPELTEVVSFEKMLSLRRKEELGIILWEDEEKRGIKEILRDRKYKDVESFFIIVGPEGGFSKDEIEKALNNSFLSASLGKFVLRTETAPLAILSILQYEKGMSGTKEIGES